MNIRKQIIINKEIIKECDDFMNETKGKIINFNQLVRHSLIFYIKYKRKYNNDNDSIKFLDND